MHIKHTLVAITALTFAGIGFASEIDPYYEYGSPPPFKSSKTRAEVRAELAQARAEGMKVGGEETSYPQQAQFKSSRTRREVRDEAARFARTRRPNLDYDVAG